MDVEIDFEQVKTTSTKPATKTGDEIKEELLAHIDGKGIVIIHCSLTAKNDMQTRIWDTTHLRDNNYKHKSTLLHAKNITLAPEWMDIQEGSTIKFTLIFSALPKNCEVFDLIEDVHDDSRFTILDIEREPKDVYHLILVVKSYLDVTDKTCSEYVEHHPNFRSVFLSIFDLRNYIPPLRHRIKIVLKLLREWWSAISA